MVCNCCQSIQCCCTGTSAVSFDEFLNPTGEECQDVEVLIDGLLANGEECDGDIISNQANTPCEAIVVVVEWCGRTYIFTGDNINDAHGYLGEFCVVGGAIINRHAIWISIDKTRLGNPRLPSFSDCEFGCFDRCQSRVIRFGIYVEESPNIGAARGRLWYVTRREGCDDTEIVENVFDNGVFCCPAAPPSVTISFAP